MNRLFTPKEWMDLQILSWLCCRNTVTKHHQTGMAFGNSENENDHYLLTIIFIIIIIYYINALYPIYK